LPQYDINLREYWRILKKRKFVVIVMSIVLGVFSTSLAILRAPNPLYTTSCSIEFQTEPHIKGVYSTTISWSDADNVETQIAIIKSYAVFQRAAEKLNLIPPASSHGDGQPQDTIIRVIESLQSKVEVERESVTSILNLSVTDSNPVFAQKLANTIALTYKELHAEQQMKETKEALLYIGEQLNEVRGKLRNAEEDFNRFTQENELISIDLQSEDLLSRSKEIQNDIRKLGEVKKEFEGIRQRLKQFIENPAGSDHDFHSTNAMARYQSTNDNLVALLLKRDTLLKDFTPKHPEVLAISHQIVENARKMAILLQLQISDMEKKEGDLRQEQEEVDRKTKVLMDKKLEFDRLKRKVELYNDMTVLLEKKNQEALIKRSAKPEEVNIVKPALLPTQPINPPNTVATGAAGVMIGLVLGIVIGFIVETFDTSLGAIEDVEQTLGTQVLGIIPQADIKDMIEGVKEKHPGGISLPDETRIGYLVSHFIPKSMMSESFRALRTNIQFKEAEKKSKAIAITSSSPQEGKTLVATNLAIAMAQARMKVLLIGSDLRKPALDTVFDVEMTPGLTDILMENCEWRTTVKTVMDIVMGKMTQTQIIRTPGLDNLHIITSGPIPPNPAELIDSTTFTKFIEEAKQEYDMIIFDSPPILSTADAAILAAKVDGVLLVYRVGSVSRGLLKRSTAQLRQVRSNIMGVILNGMRPDVSPDFQDYKYYSYYYSYGEEGKHKRSRDKKKRWSFTGREVDKERIEEQKTPVLEEGTGSGKKEDKKLGKKKLALLFVAAALLAAGIVWQNRAMQPFKASDAQYREKEEEKKSVDGKGLPSKMAIVREPTTAPDEPKPPIPVEDSKVKNMTPMPKFRPAPDAVTAPEGPAVKREISRSTPQGKSDVVSKAPKIAASVVRPESDVMASAPESPIDPKALTGTETPITKKETSPMAHTSFKKTASYPYSIRLGAFRTLERAKKAVSLYNKEGLSSYWVKVELDNETWYRVYVGHFEGRAQGEGFRKDHGLTKAKVKMTAYATLINSYAPSEGLEDQIQSLIQLGYCPYVIKYDDGQASLFAGTFVTKEGAEKQRLDLESKGVQSQIVER